jgi:hypothetical protein
MFDSALAFERYRLEVVRTWPDSEIKDKLRASIEYSLQRNALSRAQRDSPAGSEELETGDNAIADPVLK